MEVGKSEQSGYGLLIAAGILLGMGCAGFFDGIVLHEILQWHHMVTSIRPITNLTNLEINTFWDGVFHVGASLITIAGIILLWRSTQHPMPKSPKLLTGALLLGAGAFNLIEGTIDHHLLGIHHVKSGPNEQLWDITFLAINAVLAVIGWLLMQSRQREEF